MTVLCSPILTELYSWGLQGRPESSSGTARVAGDGLVAASGGYCSEELVDILSEEGVASFVSPAALHCVTER